jgi:hypothetical protein
MVQGSKELSALWQQPMARSCRHKEDFERNGYGFSSFDWIYTPAGAEQP